MIRVVLDTNVVVSALLSPDGLPAAILDLVLQRRVRAAFSEPLLGELRDVLRRPALSVSPRRVGTLLARLGSGGRLVAPASALDVCRKDPADNRVLECAEASGADFLVTGNKAHFPPRHGRTLVVSPREFWETYLLSALD